MRRLFIALQLPEDVRARLRTLQCGLPRARWVAEDNMHVTLAFVGAVEEQQARDLDAALSDVTGPAPLVALGELGTFGHKHQRKTLWAGVALSDSLKVLHDHVNGAIHRAGLDVESRKYHPHATLARLKDTPDSRVAAYMAANGAFSHPPFVIETFVLMESHLHPEGAIYEVLADYPLREE